MKITEHRTKEILNWLDDKAADHVLLFEKLHRDAAALIRQLQAAEQEAWHAGLDAGREQGGGKEHAHQPPVAPVGVDGEVRLWDSQWSNIVNAPEVLNAESQEDAVSIAVRMAEAHIAKNVAAGNLPPTKSAPQPPAEAQAQGDGEVVARHWHEAMVRDAYSRGQVDAFKDTTPPSAPVGVEGLMQLARNWCLAWGEWAHDADPGCAKENAAEAELRAALTAALAQQMAAAAAPEAQDDGEVAGWVHEDAFVDAKFWTADTPPQGWTAVYRAAPPSAPVGVAEAWQQGYHQGVLDERTSEANIGIAGFDAKVEPARVNPYLAQQTAACPKCDGTGEADSGGIHPWGAPATIPCDCQQPATVDEADKEALE